MKKRNPFLVFFLPFITLGIYSWYWFVSTKNAMNKTGEHIPTAWIWLIPFFGGIWWYWKYSEGVGHVTKEKLSGVLAFILMLLLGSIGHAIIQDYFNKISYAVASTAPLAPATPPAQPPVAPAETALQGSPPEAGK